MEIGQYKPHMLYNGELETSQAVVYRVPVTATLQTVDFSRVVNNSGAPRTFTFYVDNGAGAQPITPISVQLSTGAALVDFLPSFQLRKGGSVQGIADAAGVAWTLNVV